MDLYEYQARDVFEKYGVPVLAGIVADTPEEVKAAAEKIGGVVVVKAQVKVGGRGKAGGVKVAKTPDEAFSYASDILGMDIKGHTVHKVMIAQGADIAEEYYFSVLLDRSNRNYLAMCSVEGGMEIEQLAVERPEALARIAVDPATGIDQAKQVLAADERSRPTYVLQDLRGLSVPYPVTHRHTADDGTRYVSVGDATVRMQRNVVRVEQAGSDAMDLLRAGATAIWDSGLAIYGLDVDPQLYGGE